MEIELPLVCPCVIHSLLYFSLTLSLSAHTTEKKAEKRRTERKRRNLFMFLRILRSRFAKTGKSNILYRKTILTNRKKNSSNKFIIFFAKISHLLVINEHFAIDK